jgi:hypothetical protein
LTRTTYHFSFKKSVPMDAVEDALVLAVLAAEAVEGSARDTRRATHTIDDLRRTCVVDARTATGAAVVRVLFAYLLGMFGLRAFRVVTGDDLRDDGKRRAVARRACRCGRRRARR